MAEMGKHTDQAMAKLARGRATALPDPDDDLPAPDDRAALELERKAARRRVFETAVPALYREARLADLEPNDQHRDALAEWLQAGTRTLILSGPVGTGKTHAGYALLHQAVDTGVRVFGVTLLDLLNTMRPGAAPSPAGRLAIDAELFLFDDVATERATDWAVEQFGGILDHRTRELKRQIITTNATPAELREKFGNRIMSRLIGGATVFTFTGEDLRRRYWA
jgi:DNA replication protein DnaC